ncbi:MAG: hypothetical protein SPK06_08850 [Kiritimatiellia bacterium]|nr:hypothetical protein [Kiritimatiellia bacterium]
MPDAKIAVEICCGTTCYLLGGADLMKLEASLPEAWLEAVDIRAIPCAETCTRQNIGGAPFVRIDGEMMSHATLEKVHARLRAILIEKELIHV